MITTYTQYIVNNLGYSHHTAMAYQNDLSQFARFMRTIEDSPRWSQVTKAHVDAFVATLHEYGKANASIRRKVSAIRSFFDWCKAQGYGLEKNPARFVQMPKLGKHLPKVVEMDAIKKALQAPSTDPTTRAQIALIVESGVRLGELLAMTWEDVDLKTGAVRIHGKGNKERVVYFSARTRQILHEMTGVKAGLVFPGTDARQTRYEIFMALRTWSNARQLSPHALRHTFATEMLRNGAKMETVRDLLGHESIKTTERYAHVFKETTAKEYSLFAPAV